ncbi:ABC transporter ATP-binding protein [Candidatus Parcubacteria bacterium]|nr:MAG: ABC transporter ATP-binding protein [Candidatus Parcubacteria bacterium]
MQLLFRYVREHRKILFLALFLAAINQIFSLLDPQIFRLLIDNYASKAHVLERTQFTGGVFSLLLAAMGVALVSRIAKNFQDYYVNVITQRVGTKMYAAGVGHSFSLPYFTFEDQRSGELLQKLQKARSDAQALITLAINIGFFSAVGVIFVLIYAFTVHWLVGITYLLTIPVLGETAYLIGRRIKAAQKRIVTETAGLAGSTTETLRNVELVKSLGLEAQETERLNEANERILDLELRKVKMIRKLTFTQGTMVNALRSILMFAMLYLLFLGEMSLGQFFSLLFYSFFIFNPLAEFGNLSSAYQESSASLEVLGEVLRIPPEARPANASDPGPLKEIDFKKVSFSYNGIVAPAVKDICFILKGGETIAFVGPSGSGKTTIVKLLLGLYKPEKGAILINDIDAKNIDYGEFRKRIGYVSQETQLFAGTVRENLLFVNPVATDEDCFEALRQSAALSVIERGDKGLPTGRQGLDTRIGEGGIKVSGGERQRLAIARALLRKPELIVFDEATSSLDSITEAAVAGTIRDVARSKQNLATVLVAHRLSTVAHAKRIYVLEKGKVIEEGGHQSLLRKKGLYAALWREQSGSGGAQR